VHNEANPGLDTTPAELRLGQRPLWLPDDAEPHLLAATGAAQPPQSPPFLSHQVVVSTHSSLGKPSAPRQAAVILQQQPVRWSLADMNLPPLSAGLDTGTSRPMLHHLPLDASAAHLAALRASPVRPSDDLLQRGLIPGLSAWGTGTSASTALQRLPGPGHPLASVPSNPAAGDVAAPPPSTPFKQPRVFHATRVSKPAANTTPSAGEGLPPQAQDPMQPQLKTPTHLKDVGRQPSHAAPAYPGSRQQRHGSAPTILAIEHSEALTREVLVDDFSTAPVASHAQVAPSAKAGT
jgi:hypothetical protein